MRPAARYGRTESGRTYRSLPTVWVRNPERATSAGFIDTVLPPPATGVTVTPSPVTRVTWWAWAVDAASFGTSTGVPAEARTTAGDDAPADAWEALVATTAVDPSRRASTRNWARRR